MPMLRAFQDEAGVAFVRRSRAELVAVGVRDDPVLRRRQKRTADTYDYRGEGCGSTAERVAVTHLVSRRTFRSRSRTRTIDTGCDSRCRRSRT